MKFNNFLMNSKNYMYKLTYFFLRVLTLLPFFVLYRISDLMYLTMYYIAGYRKKVVFSNLQNSFPEKSPEEIKKIAKSFYKHLSDTLVETIKTLSMSLNQMKKRYTFKNLELFQELYDQGKDITLISGHYGNWEWMSSLGDQVPHEVLVIYHPLRNKISDKIVYKIRTKFGLKLIPMKEIYKEVLRYKKENVRSATWFIGDHRPPRRYPFWMDFMGQETQIYQGAEKIAIKLNHTVIYIDIQKVKRGKYEISFSVLFEDASETKENEITIKQVRVLEDIIRKKPDYWLWSHRRWKNKREKTPNEG